MMCEIQGLEDKDTKKIPDWPLRCPRCNRDGAAVLLFSSFDCKHGCYAGGTK